MTSEQETLLSSLMEPIDISALTSCGNQAVREIDEIIDEVSVKYFGEDEQNYEIDRRSADKVASSATNLVDDMTSEALSLLNQNYIKSKQIYQSFFSSDECEVDFPFSLWFNVYDLTPELVLDLVAECSYEKSLSVISQASFAASRNYNDMSGKYETKREFLLSFINTLFNDYQNLANTELKQKLNKNISLQGQEINWINKLSRKINLTPASSHESSFFKSQKDLFIKVSSLEGPDVKPNTFLYFIMAISYNNSPFLEEIEKKLEDKYYFNALLKLTEDLVRQIDSPPLDRNADPRDLFLHSFLFNMKSLAPSNSSGITFGQSITNNAFSVYEYNKKVLAANSSNTKNKYTANMFALENMASLDIQKFPKVSEITDLIINQFLFVCENKDFFINSTISVELGATHQKNKLEKAISHSKDSQNGNNNRIKV